MEQLQHLEFFNCFFFIKFDFNLTYELLFLLLPRFDLQTRFFSVFSLYDFIWKFLLFQSFHPRACISKLGKDVGWATPHRAPCMPGRREESPRETFISAGRRRLEAGLDRWKVARRRDAEQQLRFSEQSGRRASLPTI